MSAQRLIRTTAVVCAVLAAMATLWPRDPRVVGGVLGGGALVVLAIWSIGGIVSALGARDEGGEVRVGSRGFALVKFFTRHAILALVAYVMLVRFHLDPVGMLVGVTSVVVAAVLEAARPQ